MSAARYAVYFAPAADSPFWRFGCAWLGRDPETGETPERPRLVGQAADDWDAAALDGLLASPAGYGFHATLKPPFRLASGKTAEALADAVERFAATERGFVCPDVDVAAVGRFIAFRLAADAPEMHKLAETAVARFDEFRAPAPAAELEKRRAAGLTDRQDALLQAWGYPYIFEEFRFHMTLTGSIADAGKRDRLAQSLKRMAADAGANGAMRAEGVALYEQPAAGAPFRLLRRFPFGG